MTPAVDFAPFVAANAVGLREVECIAWRDRQIRMKKAPPDCQVGPRNFRPIELRGELKFFLPVHEQSGDQK